MHGAEGSSITTADTLRQARATHLRQVHGHLDTDPTRTRTIPRVRGARHAPRWAATAGCMAYYDKRASIVACVCAWTILLASTASAEESRRADATTGSPPPLAGGPPSAVRRSRQAASRTVAPGHVPRPPGGVGGGRERRRAVRGGGHDGLPARPQLLRAVARTAARCSGRGTSSRGRRTGWRRWPASGGGEARRSPRRWRTRGRPSPSPSSRCSGTSRARRPRRSTTSGWDRGVLRYGGGDDWQTGWTASVLGDPFARGRGSVFTVPSHDDKAWRWGPAEAAAAARKPQLRAAAARGPSAWPPAATARVLALGHMVPDFAEPGRRRDPPATAARARPGVVTAVDAATATAHWSAAPLADAPPAPRPPEPADDFPELADAFNMRPQALVPLRVAASVVGQRRRLARRGHRVRRLAAAPPRAADRLLVRPRAGHLVLPARPARPAAGLRRRTASRSRRPNCRGKACSTCGSTRRATPPGACRPSWFARGAAGLRLAARRRRRGAHRLRLRRRAAGVVRGTGTSPTPLPTSPCTRTAARRSVSCWDGRAYLVGRRRHGAARRSTSAGPRVCGGAPTARSRSPAPRRATSICLSATATCAGRPPSPSPRSRALDKPLKPVFEELPVYSVGRVGPEHAYVGDTWLIKTDRGRHPRRRRRHVGHPAHAGADPRRRASTRGDIRYVLLSHSHGDHANARVPVARPAGPRSSPRPAPPSPPRGSTPTGPATACRSRARSTARSPLRTRRRRGRDHALRRARQGDLRPRPQHRLGRLLHGAERPAGDLHRRHRLRRPPRGHAAGQQHPPPLLGRPGEGRRGGAGHRGEGAAAATRSSSSRATPRTATPPRPGGASSTRAAGRWRRAKPGSGDLPPARCWSAVRRKAQTPRSQTGIKDGWSQRRRPRTDVRSGAAATPHFGRRALRIASHVNLRQRPYWVGAFALLALTSAMSTSSSSRGGRLGRRRAAGRIWTARGGGLYPTRLQRRRVPRRGVARLRFQDARPPQRRPKNATRPTTRPDSSTPSASGPSGTGISSRG